MNSVLVLEIMFFMLALALCLQSLEFFQVRHLFLPGRPWDWRLLQKEYGAKKFWSLFMNEKNFMSLHALRLLLAPLFLMYWSPWIMLFLFFVNLLTSARFRGVFNGGSDYMMNQILLALTVGLFAQPYHKDALAVALLYIAVQSVFSYFIAGFVKLRVPRWRNGLALQKFMGIEEYSVPEGIKAFMSKQGLAFFFGWLIILFELGFPLALFSKSLLIAVFGIGFCFHLANYWAFALNRFFWAWMITYPAIWLSVERWL